MTHRIDIGGRQGRGDIESEPHHLDDGRDPDRPHWRTAAGLALLAWAVVIVSALAACQLAELIRH